MSLSIQWKSWKLDKLPTIFLVLDAYHKFQIHQASMSLSIQWKKSWKVDKLATIFLALDAYLKR